MSEIGTRIGDTLRTLETSHDAELTVNLDAPSHEEQLQNPNPNPDTQYRVGIRSEQPTAFAREKEIGKGTLKETDVGVIPTSGDNVAFNPQMLDDGGGGKLAAGYQSTEYEVTHPSNETAILETNQTSVLATEDGAQLQARTMKQEAYSSDAGYGERGKLTTGAGARLDVGEETTFTVQGQATLGMEFTHAETTLNGLEKTRYNFQSSAEITGTFGSSAEVKGRVGADLSIRDQGTPENPDEVAKTGYYGKVGVELDSSLNGKFAAEAGWEADIPGVEGAAVRAGVEVEQDFNHSTPSVGPTVGVHYKF